MPSWHVRKNEIRGREQMLGMSSRHPSDTMRRNVSMLDMEAERNGRRKLLEPFSVKMKVLLPNGQTGTIERIDEKCAVIYVREPFGPRTRVQSYAPTVLTPL